MIYVLFCYKLQKDVSKNDDNILIINTYKMFRDLIRANYLSM